MGNNKQGISDIIDSYGLNGFSRLMTFLLGIAMIFDYYDNMIVGYTMPQMKVEWALTTVQTGTLTTFSLLGAMIGGAFSGIIADKIGRKKTLVASVCLYGVMTLPIYFVNSYGLFAACRIIAGLGVGACIPVVITMISEFTPTKHRAVYVTIGLCFLALGAIASGLVGTFVVPVFGWRICYFIGGIPIAYAILLHYTVYESPYYLASHGKKKEALEVLYKLEKIAKGTRTELSEDVLILPPKPKTVGVKALFSKNYIRITIGLWIMYACGCFIIYGIGSWLPSLMLEKGYALTAAYALGLSNNIASFFGNLATGRGAEIFGRKKNIVAGFFISAVMFVILAKISGSFVVIFATIFVTSFFFNYGTTGVQPLMPESYPTEFRNTGVAWCNAFGKVGGILAPIVAGIVISTGVTFSTAIMVFTIPAVIAGIAGLVFIQKETKGKSMDQLAMETEQGVA